MVKSDNIIDAVNSFVNSLEEEQKNENILKNKIEQENDTDKGELIHDRLPEDRTNKKNGKLPEGYGNIRKKKHTEINGNQNHEIPPKKHGNVIPGNTYENGDNLNTEKTYENKGILNYGNTHENHGRGFQKLADIVKKSIELIAVDKAIRVEPDKEKFRISVYGKDLAVVIGKNGTVMDALEYLINLIGKRKKLVEKNVVIDIKDYRKKNDEKIKEIAINMAKKALKERKNIALRPMPSHERKIVHNILSKVKNIRTKSRDDEPNRRIIIYPVIKD